MSKFRSILSDYLLPSFTRRGWGWVSHAFALIREDKLFSAIYIAGTAVAIASAMVIAVILNIMLADIPPESNRSRTLYLGAFFDLESTPERSPNSDYATQNYSTLALDSCFRQLKCVEVATGVMSTFEFVCSEDRQHMSNASVMRCDPDFFRLYDLDFLSGRPFSEKEFREGERVCVVSDRLLKRLGGVKHFIIPNHEDCPTFRIVGVIKAVSGVMVNSAADIYVPYMESSFGKIPTPELPSPVKIEGDSIFLSSPISYESHLRVRILLRKGCSRQDFIDEIEPLRRHYNAMTSAKIGEKMEWTIIAHTNMKEWMNFTRNDNDDLKTRATDLLPPTILILLFLFLPAINLSGLVSNRMEARRAEMGIRKAFGAKRRTLLNEVVNENLVLTLLGGFVGWLLSWLFIMAVSNSDIFHSMFRGEHLVDFNPSLDFQMFFTPTLFLVAFLCCAVLNLMAALLPAWHSLRKPIVESLNQKR